MARMTVVVNSILPRQEAFLVDAPTPNTSPHRWIQAKPESTDWPLVSAGFAGWWRVGVGRGVSRRVWCVGACRVGVGGWVGLVALGCVWGVPAPGGWVFR